MKKYRKIRRRKKNHSQENFFQKETETKPGFFENKTKEPFFNSNLPVQTKLTIGEPGDKFENEADNMADGMLNKAEEEEAQPMLQKQEEEEAQPMLQKQQEEEEAIQPKLQKQEEEEAIQPKLAGATNQPSTKFVYNLSAQNGKGQKLPRSTANEMGQFFKADFSGVNIHTDGPAQKLNSEINAQAFTHGKDIYFNKGKFNPDSKTGKHLLAHELTHVVQQKGNEIQRDLIRDPATHVTTGVRFRKGTDVAGAFYDMAKRLASDGGFSDADIRRCRREATVNRGTMNDYERLMLAGLMAAGNRAILAGDATGTVTFPAASITEANRNHVNNLDRDDLPADVLRHMEDALRAIGEIDLVGFAEAIGRAEDAAMNHILNLNETFRDNAAQLVAFVGANNLSYVSTVNAMYAAASDSSGGDRIFAGMAWAVAAQAGSPIAAEVLSGAVKVDALVPSAFAALPGVAPNVEAAYLTFVQESGLKGNTLYVQTSLDLTNLRHRSTIIHELAHAQDDANAAVPGTIQFEQQNQLEANAYRTQARYILDQMVGMTPAELVVAANEAANPIQVIILMAMVRETMTNQPVYLPLATQVFAAAPPPNNLTRAQILAVIGRGAAAIDRALLDAINAGYGLTDASQFPIDGLVGGSLLD